MSCALMGQRTNPCCTIIPSAVTQHDEFNDDYGYDNGKPLKDNNGNPLDNNKVDVDEPVDNYDAPANNVDNNEPVNNDDAPTVVNNIEPIDNDEPTNNNDQTNNDDPADNDEPTGNGNQLTTENHPTKTSTKMT